MYDFYYLFLILGIFSCLCEALLILTMGSYAILIVLFIYMCVVIELSFLDQHRDLPT